MRRRNTINAPLVRPGPEINVLLELFRNGLWLFDRFAVHVGYVEITVRSRNEVGGPEPHVGGCQKLFVLLAAVRDEVDSILLQDVAMHQVSGHVAREDIAPIVFWEDIAVVDRAPARRREIAAGRQQALLASSLLIFVLLVKAFLPDTAALHAPRLRLGDRKHLRRGA